MRIITVSREFGSGGRELGKRLADELGVAYYDTEIIEEVAKQTELNKNYIAEISENGLENFAFHFGRSFGVSFDHTAMNVLVAQHNVIRELAGKGDCVIVGRGADVILSKLRPFKIFVYASSEYKIARCRQKNLTDSNISDKEMLKKFKEIDGGRKKLHELLASDNWGECEAYNLCVNTGGYEIKDIVPAVAEFSKRWFEKEDENKPE